MSRPTAGQAVREKCMDCMSVEPRHRGMDCLSQCCPLYACSPFRGKTDTSRLPDETAAVYVELMAAAHAKTPYRQPSLRLIAEMCRECIGDCGPHCTSKACPLLPLTPLQPGGRPKVKGREREGSLKHLQPGQTLALLRTRGLIPVVGCGKPKN